MSSFQNSHWSQLQLDETKITYIVIGFYQQYENDNSNKSMPKGIVQIIMLYCKCAWEWQPHTDFLITNNGAKAKKKITEVHTTEIQTQQTNS
eukprot:349459_1